MTHWFENLIGLFQDHEMNCCCYNKIQTLFAEIRNQKAIAEKPHLSSKNCELNENTSFFFSNEGQTQPQLFLILAMSEVKWNQDF